MKSQSQKISSQFIVLQTSTQMMKNEKKQPNTYCPFSSKLFTHTCMSQQCKQKAFICDDQQCKCQQNHKKCLKLKITSLLDHLQQKKVPIIQSFQTFISDKIQTMIDQLSDFRDNIIKKIKEKFEFFGLNETEKQFLKSFQDVRQSNSIIGSKVWQIIHLKDKKQDILTHINQTYQSFEEDFEKAKNDVSLSLLKINIAVEKCLHKSQQLINCGNDKKQIDEKTQLNKPEYIKQALYPQKIESKIATTQAQFNRIKQFLQPKIIKSIQLLYRASQNKFNIQKFHQVCDDVPNTLVLLKTKFYLNIGGYTPLKWSSQTGYVEDKQMGSFLFSLTDNMKFQLKDKQHAIYNNPLQGPTFGNGNDLRIYNKSYMKKCFMNMNHAYEYQQFSKKRNKIRQSLHGNRMSDDCQIIQWEVWKLMFVQI